jgi:integrase
MLKANKSPNTTNRYLESAAALFAPETLKHIDTTIENPFKTVAKCKRPSSRFHSTFDFEALVQSALSELEGDTLAAFVLTAIGGMRKSEVDNLLWSSVDWNRNTVAVKHTHYWSPKSESSMRSVAFDPEFFAMFKGLHAKATTPFILSSPVQPRKEFPAGWYRASHTFNRLAAWLKAHGVNDRKPLHTMRKACGSVVNHRLGLFAASQFLGHSSTTITSRYYVEAKEVITSGFGHLVKPSENVVPMTTEEQQPTTESVAQ